MRLLSRRSFLKHTALAGTAAALSARSWSQVTGANSAVRVAVVGLGCGPMNRGQVHLKNYQKIRGVRLAGLCDVDSAVLGRVAAGLRTQGLEVPTYRDVRELLARSDIDAISIATPNHWHSLLGIWGCQAGKDVYVEKPVSHNLWEGRQLVRAAAKYSRVVQAGTQSRSNQGLAEAVGWVRAGNLGRIVQARGLCYRRRPSIGLTHGPQPVPATVDYDLWLGPAPMQPPRRKQFHYDWHWFWPTGNGDIGNDGAHRMDVARWFLGEPALAPHTLAVGGRLGYLDDGETPNTEVVVHGYPAAPLIFEVRGLPTQSGTEKMDTYEGVGSGVVVRCEGGSVIVGRKTQAFDGSGRLVKSFADGDSSSLQDHFANFISVVRSRKVAELRAPVLEGHVSTSLCHTANISYRLGQSSSPGEIRERIKGDPDLAEAFGRMSEHLARNGVDLAKTPATLGHPLALDPATERFLGNDGANALRTRAYRSPYIVPDLE